MIGALARTRTWNHRLGGSSYILFNYKGCMLSIMPKHLRQRKSRPVSRPQEPAFEGVVRDLASDGRAVVAHPDGRAFLVPGLWPGESARVKPVGRHGGAWSAELLEIKDASDSRVQPVCAHQGVGAGQCGGCPWMFVDYAAQTAAKLTRLSSYLQKLPGGESALRPLVEAPQALGYRNRAQLKTDGKRLGFMAAGSRELVDISHCPVLSPPLQLQLKQARAALPRNDWRPRHRRERWRDVGFDEQATEVSLDQRTPFRQGNSLQNERMLAWLEEALGAVDGSSKAMELFAGAGNFTSVLAARFGEVVAAEGDTVLTDQLAHIVGVTPITMDLFDEVAMGTFARDWSHTEVLLLDPPRDGLKVREPLLANWKELTWVFYISCNPATWARDVKDFAEKGFALLEVTPIDLFPQTPHLEIMSVLHRV